jgi:hypothetical protein
MRKAMLLSIALVIALMGPAAWADAGTTVSFIVDVPFGGSETIIASSIPGCPSGTVTTTGEVTFRGPIGRFFGTKVFDCGASGTFTLEYRASAFACSPTDSGTWKIRGGTGIYAGMSGVGHLTGTFYGGEPCAPAGIVDAYTGTIRLVGV